MASYRAVSLFSTLICCVVLLPFCSGKSGKWKIIWIDQFNGRAGALPSSSNWIYDTGTSYPGGPPNWGTGEIQTYTTNKDNLSLDGKGNLKITPWRDSSGNWTSARIETRRTDFKPPKGGKLAIEGRIRMPDVTGEKALGYWPAFWTLGAPLRGNYHNWPGIGEFDILENVNGINKVWATFHCGVNGGGPCNEPSGIGANRDCPGPSCQSSFHQFRFEWDESTKPKELRWYIDGLQYHRVVSTQVDEKSWTDATKHGHFLLLNVAIGGGFPNGVAGQTTPTDATEPGHSMLVDYVVVMASK